MKHLFNFIMDTIVQLGLGGGGYDELYKKFGKPGDSKLFLKLKWLEMLLFEHGFSAEDFFTLHLYEKSRSQRRDFVSLWRSKEIIRELNKNCNRELVENKAVFGEYFKEFLHRNQISSNNLSWESFLKFYDCEHRIICKPTYGFNGNGIFIVENNSSENQLRKVYEIISKASYVLETVLVQDGILRELNPHTLNTVRVNVLNNHGKMIIPNAILRSGQGRVVTDNICAGGCVTEIDVETGKFISKFVDLSNHIYDEHPISHIKLYGKYMPCWEEIKRVAFEATKKFTGVGYASWDIAVIVGNQVAIIEGNSYGNFNIQQVPLQRGVWPVYKQFIKEWRKRNREICDNNFHY